MAFRRSGYLAKKVLLPGLSSEIEIEVSRQPERVLRRAGSVSLGQICLPSRLQKSIKSALEDSPTRNLRRDVVRLSEIMRARSSGWPIGKAKNQGPPENKDANLEPWEETGKMISQLLKPGKGPAPEYHETASAAYMAARMPSSYAALLRIFQELKTRLPDFHPSSLMDFGTGPGTAIWAAQGAWPDSPKRVVAVEPASAMIDLCSQLLQGNPDMPKPQHFQTLDAASRVLRGNNRLFNLVIASYSLGELEDEERENIVRRLWGHTRDMLVLVEPGNPKGWQLVADARTQILQQEFKALRKKGTNAEKREDDYPMGAHVVAPCAHDGRCPMEGTKSWCHFVQRLQRSEVQRVAKKAAGTLLPQHEDEKFSFVVLRRGVRPIKESPLANLEEIERRTKDVKTIQEGVRSKHGVYMKHLMEALRRDPKKIIPQGEDMTAEESRVMEGSDEVRKRERGDKRSVGKHGNYEEEGEDEDEGDDDDGEDEGEGEDEDEEGEDEWDEEEEQEGGEEEEEEEERVVPEVNSGWSRIVRAPRRRGAHVLLDMCCATSQEGKRGELQRHIITHRSRKMDYRFARRAQWGDLWPL